jgi:hypothetical protein
MHGEQKKLNQPVSDALQIEILKQQGYPTRFNIVYYNQEIKQAIRLISKICIAN